MGLQLKEPPAHKRQDQRAFQNLSATGQLQGSREAHFFSKDSHLPRSYTCESVPATALPEASIPAKEHCSWRLSVYLGGDSIPFPFTKKFNTG